jgi:hypothetical protein
MVSGMDAPPIAMPTAREIAPTGVVMSSAEYAVLTRELERLRASHRREMAQRLHDVRAHGTTSDDDDRLAVLEKAAIDRRQSGRRSSAPGPAMSYASASRTGMSAA